MVEARIAVGSAIGLTSQKNAPAELYLFENIYCPERINVVLTFSAEAMAKMAGRLR